MEEETGLIFYGERVILSLDPPKGVDIDAWMKRVYEPLMGFVAGWKVGWPLILRWGVDRVRRFLVTAPGLTLLDLKLADVRHTMENIIDVFIDVASVVIAHAFVGRIGALAELKDLLDEHGVKLALVYSMTHQGASEVMEKCLTQIEEVIDNLKPWALIAPATKPSLISRARRRYPDIVIFSPGVGAQGAHPGSAICAGADYEIIGRSIVQAPDPWRAFEDLSLAAAQALFLCREEQE